MLARAQLFIFYIVVHIFAESAACNRKFFVVQGQQRLLVFCDNREFRVGADKPPDLA